ncbi:phosphatase PAP2 family protein [Segetibacter sp. 3557_3]|uniref:phosphatase PAP2 family protein n=1 Tax=Segetibacter sp. 3557_3 TaxID=2547429 RepID=UPI0014056083|nr:phosphatase PAP2 family protein [Segetibacter sp. 3557_3]
MRATINLNTKRFFVATGISLLLAVVILYLSFAIGRKEFFLLLNTDLGSAVDLFFQYFTFMGDGILWVLWLIWIFRTKRKQLLPLILASFALTTIFTQVFKYFILPDELRPSKAFDDLSQVHFVQGVTVHATSSFPSGHTATAFTFVLLFALTVKRVDTLVLAFIVAVLVGYSRVYLGQHFPLDLGGGIIVAIFSVSLAYVVQKRYGGG